ncbi:hypothetical protein FRB95_014824 [Tulasnella sp. JGI-2019a]|nr:hypothetical protein FRB95_014824 [Tulasnella sp. JGI-2019a]
MTETASHYSAYTKDPNYYFTDGTLCIVVEQTMFRVHKGVVARQSEVFKDMFEITGPVSDDAGDEVFENAPVIKVEDKAADIRALFSLMYNAPPRDVPFDLIASTLRVAEKYGIEQYQA